MHWLFSTVYNSSFVSASILYNINVLGNSSGQKLIVVLNDIDVQAFAAVDCWSVTCWNLVELAPHFGQWYWASTWYVLVQVADALTQTFTVLVKVTLNPVTPSVPFTWSAV